MTAIAKLAKIHHAAKKMLWLGRTCPTNHCFHNKKQTNNFIGVDTIEINLVV